jgi:hypothetical protein
MDVQMKDLEVLVGCCLYIRSKPSAYFTPDEGPYTVLIVLALTRRTRFMVAISEKSQSCSFGDFTFRRMKRVNLCMSIDKSRMELG